MDDESASPSKPISRVEGLVECRLHDMSLDCLSFD